MNFYDDERKIKITTDNMGNKHVSPIYSSKFRKGV